MNLCIKKQKHKCQKRVRTLFQSVDKSVTNFSSIDYLCLSTHPYIKEQAIAYSVKWGAGLLPSRLLPSYELALNNTEDLLAKFLGHESITFFESDLKPLANLSKINNQELLSTHSICLKTGSIVSIDELIKIKKKSKSLLVVDDSLSFSLFGNHGFGIAAQKKEVDLLLGSFPKCFGSYISFVACSKKLKTQLFEAIPSLHKERFIPPLFLGMIDATLELLPSMQAERKKVFHLKNLLQKTLSKTTFCPLETKAPFVQITSSNPLEIKNLQLHLLDHYFMPTLLTNGLTFFPNLLISEKEITDLLFAFSSYKEVPIYEAL